MLVKLPTTVSPVLGGVVAGKTETVKRVVAFGATVLGLATPLAKMVVPPPPLQAFGELLALRGAEGVRVEKSLALLSVS